MYSDDLSSMGAINQRYGVADAVLQALQAGADVALWVTTDEVPAVLDRLEKALAAGELSRGRVDESVLRVAGPEGPQPPILTAHSSVIAYSGVSRASRNAPDGGWYQAVAARRP